MGKERKDSMNAAIALIPFVLIRVFLFQLLDKNRYNKAQKFAPLENKQGYYIIYQFVNYFYLFSRFSIVSSYLMV